MAICLQNIEDAKASTHCMPGVAVHHSQEFIVCKFQEDYWLVRK